MAIYTRSDLKTAIAGRIFGKAGILTNINTTVNNAVRNVMSTVDLASAKRKSTIAPDLFNDIYQYNCPTDMKGIKVVGIQPQDMDRSLWNIWELIGEEEFDQRKQSFQNLVSFSDRSMVRSLLISARPDNASIDISQLNSLSNGGDWTAFGDAENLAINEHNYIKGSASIVFDISAAAGTTAGIQSSNVNTYDLTKYYQSGSVFTWAYLTNASDITNFKLRLGNSSTAYYEMTATSTNESTAFATGWNLLRFDMSGRVTTGTVTNNSCDYVALYMTKATSKVSQTGFQLNWLSAKLGKINNFIYYSKYAWQNAAGTWIKDSTEDTDYINCEEDEYNMFIESMVYEASLEIRETTNAAEAKRNLTQFIKDYRMSYKSEALQPQNTYYYFGTNNNYNRQY